MEITVDLIEHLARLSKLEFTKQETAVFKEEFADIVKHIDNIQKINTDDVVCENECLDAENELREDKVLTNIDRSQLQKIAPEFERGCFVVPLVVE